MHGAVAWLALSLWHSAATSTQFFMFPNAVPTPSSPSSPTGPEPTNESTGEAATGNNIDTDALSKLPYPLGKHLKVGGRLNGELRTTRNYDLDATADDNLVALEEQLTLALGWTPREDLFGYLEVRPWYTAANDDTGSEVSHGRVELKRAFLSWNPRGSGLTLALGRQRFSDSRQWFLNEDLDALRLLWAKDELEFEISMSRRLFQVDHAADEYTNYLASLRHRFGRRDVLSLFALTRRDRKGLARNPSQVGIEWIGRPGKRDRYWLDLATSLGRVESVRRLGFGLNAGFSHRFKARFRPNLTLAYAFGTGDADTSDGTDAAFHQTGLHDNKGKFFGRTKFSYFGEIADIDLSNMHVLTLGTGCELPWQALEIDVVAHIYRQAVASRRLRDSDLPRRLTGDSGALGIEIDVIAAIQPLARLPALQVALIAGRFAPGEAFPTRDAAWLLKLKAQWDF